MSARFPGPMFVTLLFLAGLSSGRPICAQDCPCPPAQPSSPYDLAADFADAANKWQLTVIDPKSQVDTVSPDVRQRRDAFWKPPLESLRGVSGVHGASLPGMPPEFPVQPGDVWVIATFENFHVFQINHDPELIYTEMNFRVEHVFRRPASVALSTGALVDAGITGGRIKTTAGDVVSPGWLRPLKYGPQLGHKYLIQFLYESQGAVFIAGKRWDISSGKVEMEGPQETARAAQGKSAIAGKSVTDLVNYLPSILPGAPEKEDPEK
jgi:hypothetical protein